ncbi:MAG: ABC transporter permease [Parvibaculaceae bacterium]
MLSLVARRIALGVATVWIVSVLIFAATEILPGDIATAILGQNQTPEAVEAIRVALGLDRPAAVRYMEWLTRFIQGDLGRSLASQRAIGPDLRERLANTIFLAASSALCAIPPAILLGLLAATFRNTKFDRVISALTLITISVPEFFVGYVLIAIFAVKLDWFPSVAIASPGAGLGSRLETIALPMTTLVLVVFAHVMRLTRASVITTLGDSYIETAVLKGCSRWRVVFHHALPNALGPITNIIAVNLAYLFVGVVVVEVVFVYPGMGQLMVDAIAKRDVPVIQSSSLIFAFVYIGINVLADVLGIVSNPKLRRTRQS